MTHLGHKSRAIHAAYAGGVQVAVLPLEFYEAEKAKKILKFDENQASEPTSKCEGFDAGPKEALGT